MIEPLGWDLYIIHISAYLVQFQSFCLSGTLEFLFTYFLGYYLDLNTNTSMWAPRIFEWRFEPFKQLHMYTIFILSSRLDAIILFILKVLAGQMVIAREASVRCPKAVRTIDTFVKHAYLMRCDSRWKQQRKYLFLTKFSTLTTSKLPNLTKKAYS